MSTDLYVATRLKPSEQQLRDLWTRQTGVVIEGTFAGGGTLVIEEVGGGPLCVIDAPTRVNAEEIDALPAGIRPRPRWLLFLSVPAAGEERGVTLTYRVALALAGICDGVVYDPRTDEVVQSNGQREAVKQPDKTRISTVSVSWFLPISHFTPETGETFLAVADRIMPQVTPRRRADFLSWLAIEHESIRDAFFWWKGRKPCFNGYAYVETRPTARSRAVPAWKIELDLHEEPIRTNPRVRETLIHLFTSVGTEVGAFYGAAYVEREVVLTGRSIGYDFGSFRAQSVVIPTWGGLPRFAMWLSWYGPPYRDLVAPALGDRAIEVDGGLLLRLAELPADPMELAGQSPSLPEELTQNSRREVRTHTYPNGMYGTQTEAVHERADHIPPLD